MLLLGLGVFIRARFTEANAKRAALRAPAIEALRQHPRSLSLVTTFAVWCGPETHSGDIRADSPEDLAADASMPLLDRA